MLALALAAALPGGARQRRLAGAGLLLLGLALAAWRAGSPEGALTSPGRLGRGFLVGNGGLLLLAVTLVGAAWLSAPPGGARWAGRLLTGLGLAVLAPVLAGFLGAAGPLRAAGAALALGLAGIGLAAGGRALVRTPAGRLGRRLARPPLDPVQQRPPALAIAFLAGALAAAALGPHVAVVFAATSAAAWAAYLAFHRRGDRPVPVAPVLTLLLLPAYWLLATVTGPVGLGVGALPQAPLSPAAELLVSPALLLAAWVTTGLWPLQRQLPGAMAAPAGALLLSRVALPLVPEGLAYWRPLAVPVVILGLWNAAAFGRWPLLAAGAGVLGIASATPPGVAAGPWLLAAGLGLELSSITGAPAPVKTLARAAAWSLGAYAGMQVLEGGLRGEVVYTTLGTLALALIVAAGRGSVCQAR